jgi:hypothetical protein
MFWALEEQKARDEHADLGLAVRDSVVSGACRFGIAPTANRAMALIIGNANYPDANAPIPTAINDVRTLADELRRNDFDVDLKENVGKEEMQRAIDVFTGKIRSGVMALFYFNGFGIQVTRQTYLIPVNGQVWTEADARRDGISLDAVLAEVHRKGARVKIVIVDAARRNPFERRFRTSAAGLAALDAPDGTLAMYAAALSKVINDGGYGKRPPHRLPHQPLILLQPRPQLQSRLRLQRRPRPSRHPRPHVSRRLPPHRRPEISPAMLSGTARNAVTWSSYPPACSRCSDSNFEEPVHRVTIVKPFAIGRHEVTFEEWDRCVAAGRCKYKPDDRGWGRENRPVINISWVDAKEFLSWLSEKAGKTYRLPTEAEWEYAARGGSNTIYWWGREVGARQANCRECATGSALQTLPVGSFKPNAVGLYDMAGNVAEGVEDCWNDSYRGAPQSGSAWMAGQCSLRVLRGGAFDSQAKYVGSAARFRYDSDVRYVANGFRVLRELP